VLPEHGDRNHARVRVVVRSWEEDEARTPSPFRRALSIRPEHICRLASYACRASKRLICRWDKKEKNAPTAKELAIGSTVYDVPRTKGNHKTSFVPEN
jgi:hypothetical protein